MSQSSLFPIGSLVDGRYRVEEVIAKGAEVVFYRATRTELDVPVVLQVLTRADPTPDWLERFRAQVRVLAKLRHPTIVPYIDHGETREGVPYFVLEHVEGSSVFRRLGTSRPFRPREAVAVGLDVARGLQYAHDSGVMHLHLTPANVMLPTSDTGVRARIVGFTAGRYPHIEPESSWVVDPRVAAPEVIRGAQPDAAADVYGFGHLMAAMLMGNSFLESRVGARDAHLFRHPWKLPSTVDVDDELRGVVERCMAKDKARRYANMTAVIEALEAWAPKGDARIDDEPTRLIQRPVAFPSVGDRVGRRYRLESVLGTGAFGRVYRAVDEETSRTVALKVLNPVWYDDEREQARFEREGRVASLLQNPHTITVLDFGVTGRGYCFMATEFVAGRTLDELLAARGTIPPAEVGAIVEQVLDSLGEAHANGVVHRDIKPSNIILSARDFRGTHGAVTDCWATVLDFGVAQVHREDFTARSLTTTGGAIGTVRYMAPERLLGADATPASDLYSLGLVAYELLTGEKAVAGSSTGEIVANQMKSESVSLPVESSPDQLLVHAVNKMMHKDLTARYVDTAAVARDLGFADQARTELIDVPDREGD